MKAVLPRWFSFTAFVATQVVIDVETLVHMLRQEWPVHREFHSYIGATSTGFVTALVTFGTLRMLRAVVVRFNRNRQDVPADWKEGVGAAILGGLIGGASHTLLDSIMHQDVQPLWPFASQNGMVGSLSVWLLHLLCLLAALCGGAILLVHRPLEGNERK